MKQILSVFLCALVLFSLTVPALADEDSPPDWLYPVGASPSGEDADDPPDWLYPAGTIPAAKEPEEADESDPEPPPAPVSEPEPDPAPAESVGEKNVSNTSGNPPDHAAAPVDPSPSGGYPVGSYITPSGQVWSPSGEILSPPDAEAETLDEISPPPLDVLDRSDSSGQMAVTPGTAYVTDLRPKDASPAVLDGLKALVTSIFGEYTPVTTTSVITQTVGDDT